MKFRGGVEILYDKCQAEDIPRIKRILPIFEFFAKIARVRILIDAPPAGYAPMTDCGADETINVHLCVWPQRLSVDKLYCSGTLFWQKVPENLLMAEPIIPSVVEVMTIKAPEFYKVALASTGIIWILFDCLRDDWEAEKLKKILFFILYLALPRTLDSSGKRWSADQYLARKEAVASRFVRRIFREQKIGEILPAIRSFIEANALSQLKEISALLRRYAADFEKEKEEYFHLMNTETDLEEQLAYIRTNIDRRKFSYDFRLILNMEGVETVRVNNAGWIVVYTKRILKTPGQQGSNCQTFDIGKYEIAIDPAAMNHNGIHFHQGRYCGTYLHGYAKENNTCFGQNQADGLNHIMDKHMQDFNIVAIVGLCLAFLRKESTTPSPRNSFMQQDSQGFEDEYVSADDMRTAENKFIAVMEEALYARRTSVSQEKLNAIRKEVAQKRLSLGTLRCKLRETQSFSDRLEDKLRALDAEAAEELSRLAGDRSVVWIEPAGTSLEIYLSLSDLHNVCVILDPNYPPRILGYFLPWRWCSARYTLSNPFEAGTAFSDRMLKLQRTGRIHAFISYVKKLLLAHEKEGGEMYD